MINRKPIKWTDWSWQSRGYYVKGYHKRMIDKHALTYEMEHFSSPSGEERVQVRIFEGDAKYPTCTSTAIRHDQMVILESGDDECETLAMHQALEKACHKIWKRLGDL